MEEVVSKVFMEKINFKLGAPELDQIRRKSNIILGLLS